ncbi:MAG: DIP1984 family protein [Syntrophorhabdaceae bacterium]|nr:DIP1984 family protein [Syntrophorhabdaceae bacterium]
MKLAEALIMRVDAQKNIAQLRERLLMNAKVQDGDTPTEDPEMLLQELESATKFLIGVIRSINKTNVVTIAGDKTIAELLAERDARIRQVNIMRDFLKEASNKVDRYSAKEIATVSSVNVAEKQKELDALSKEIRQMDTRIQELNWLTELV